MGKIYSYRLKFYLNATHAMRWSDQIGEEHPHTWEIICQVMKKEQNHFIRFNDIEDQIQKIIDPLQNQFLNTLAPFDKTNPSLENLGDYFFDEINLQLHEINCYLHQLEIGESPTRFYVVNNE